MLKPSAQILPSLSKKIKILLLWKWNPQEEDTTTDNTNNSSPRPVQKLGEALRKHESRSLANKNKEQLQEACKTLGLRDHYCWTRPRPSPVSVFENQRDRYRVQSRFLRINETDTESSLDFWESTRPRPRPGLEPPKVRDFNETETRSEISFLLWSLSNCK